MICHVYWWLAGLIGLVVGVGGAVLVTRAVRASRNPVDTLATPVRAVPVDPSLQAALDLLESPAAVVGAHDEVLHSNEAAEQGALVEGSRVADQAVLALVRDARRRDEGEHRDVDLRRAPHQPVLHWTVVTGPIDGHGNMVLVVVDRSPLMRADRARRDFVANISHELKTPIGAVSILAEAVEDAADDPDGVRHFSTRLQAEATRLNELVTQVIDLSRLQSDEPLLRPEPTGVADVVHEAIGRMSELARRRDVDLVITVEDGLMVRGEPTQLTDAVANLVQNAIVYSQPGARVAVSGRTGEDGRVEIAVSDNGIGIAPADQQRIFERFYRVDYARSRDNGGTGLGLSLVKHIARVHGGTVDVWSKLGQGSTFTMRLPAAPDGAPDAGDDRSEEQDT